MWILGPYRRYGLVNWQQVERLVFVCQGNICRSPFAQFAAESKYSGLPVASFGLATTTGCPADSMAIDVAADYGLDLDSHRATDLTDFELLHGDLLLVMEDRHIGPLKAQCLDEKFQICLLGLWCRPRFALLYDPHCHSREYFAACFDRIDRAVTNLLREYRDVVNDQGL